ncbi:transcriptional regulator GntR family [Clostridium sp. CAG:411]|jgi:GntR family transcriptional regulator|nr:GntR family transcriptional regulator [Lachnospiraceae bacterium]CDE47109.1 transcriptional regulator GntR family [Clostridium sp. CAG:411]
MRIDFSQVTPIYIQIADAIEDDILLGKLKEGEKCYSQVVLAKELNINPATAAKGIRLLVERGVLEKVRGQAMTVKVGAMKEIKERKVEEILGEIIERLVDEATKLGIGEDALVERVKEAVKRKSEKE